MLQEIEEFKKYTIKLVLWDWVVFRDGYIIIIFPDDLNTQYKVNIPEVKSCFNYIHKRIEIILPPFKIKFYYKLKQIVLKDILEFNSIIRYFDIQVKLADVLSKKEIDFNLYRNCLPNRLDKYYYPSQKSIYLNYLCVNQCFDYKIIPLYESKISKGVLIRENSFLFTLSNRKFNYSMGKCK